MGIVQYPNSILTTPCPPADIYDWKRIGDAIGELKAGMASTRKAVGLSAPQVGHSIRIFILDTNFLKLPDVSQVFINPVLIDMSSLTDSMDEECMSLPAGVKVAIRRPIACTVEASNKEGYRFTVELKGLAARAMQHEIDHLDGKMILDYATKKQKRDAMQRVILALKKRSVGR